MPTPTCKPDQNLHGIKLTCSMQSAKLQHASARAVAHQLDDLRNSHQLIPSILTSKASACQPAGLKDADYESSNILVSIAPACLPARLQHGNQHVSSMIANMQSSNIPNIICSMPASEVSQANTTTSRMCTGKTSACQPQNADHQSSSIHADQHSRSIPYKQDFSMSTITSPASIPISTTSTRRPPDRLHAKPQIMPTLTFTACQPERASACRLDVLQHVEWQGSCVPTSKAQACHIAQHATQQCSNMQGS